MLVYHFFYFIGEGKAVIQSDIDDLSASSETTCRLGTLLEGTPVCRRVDVCHGRDGEGLCQRREYWFVCRCSTTLSVEGVGDYQADVFINRIWNLEAKNTLSNTWCSNALSSGGGLGLQTYLTSPRGNTSWMCGTAAMDPDKDDFDAYETLARPDDFLGRVEGDLVYGCLGPALGEFDCVVTERAQVLMFGKQALIQQHQEAMVAHTFGAGFCIGIVLLGTGAFLCAFGCFFQWWFQRKLSKLGVTTRGVRKLVEDDDENEESSSDEASESAGDE